MKWVNKYTGKGQIRIDFVEIGREFVGGVHLHLVLMVGRLMRTC